MIARFTADDADRIAQVIADATAVHPADRSRTQAVLADLAMFDQLEPVVEHAIQMAGGGMQVRANFPELKDVYPLDKWIKGNQRFGGKVYTRTIIVVEDWHEVPE